MYRQKLENTNGELKELNDVEILKDDEKLYTKWKLKYQAFLLKEPKCEVNMEWVHRTLQNYKAWVDKSGMIDCSDYPDVESRLLNFVKIEKPLKKPTIHPRSCPITEEEYTNYKKTYLHMMDNCVIKNRTADEYDEWNERYTKWKNTPQIDINKVEKRLKLYIGKIENYNQRLVLEKELEALTDVEFNHECWACKKNPFSIKKTVLLEKYKALNVRGNITKWKDIVAEAMIQIEQHNEYMRDKTVYEKEEVYWKDILDTWDKYDKWKLYSDRILNDIEYYENYTYSQLWKKYKTQEEIHSKLLEEYHSKKEMYGEKQEWDSILVNIEKYKSIYELYEIWSGEHTILLQKLKDYELSMKRRKLESEKEEYEKEYLTRKRRSTILTKYENDKNMFYSYKLHKVDKELKILLDEKSKQDANNEIIKKHKDSLDNLVALEELYNGRIVKIKELELLFIGDKVSSDGYKEWIYKTQVIPLINSEMNAFLNMFEQFMFRMIYDKKNFIYLLEDRGNLPTLDKASGYQNFIIGLAFRIILTRIGAIGQQLKHLFIDEGFTACDSVNIEKVPALLKSILKYGGYESILIMSHLDSVRDCTSIHINIERKDPFSYIRT
jgi:DNA repair exonuclease SbcCD ATPase subunit